MAHGDFLWFYPDGKSYVVDDPQTIARIQAMYKPMEDLGRKQEELGRNRKPSGASRRNWAPARAGHRPHARRLARNGRAERRRRQAPGEEKRHRHH